MRVEIYGREGRERGLVDTCAGSILEVGAEVVSSWFGELGDSHLEIR